MQAIVPNRPARVRPYAWGSVMVNPNPPRVGEVTRIGFPLANPGPGEVIVERIDVGVARFGMGLPWEDIGSVGPIHLPPDPARVEEAIVEWTPQEGGHRCVRAYIHVQDVPTAMVVGRNLDVIEAGAHETRWGVPFHLGNPDPVRAPIVLRLDMEAGGAAVGVHAAVRVGQRIFEARQPIWLEPGEVLPAELRLAAPAGEALNAIQRVEAWIGDRFIDGIQVTVLRPALALPRGPDDRAWAGALVEVGDLAAVG